MANDKIGNEIFVTILRIRKINNRANFDSIYKKIKKEFPGDGIHALINDGKIINKLYRNADSYYVNSNLVDLETPNLLKSSQSVQRIAFANIDSLSNSNGDFCLDPTLVYTSVGCKQNSPITRGHIKPTLYIPNSFEDTPTLNVSETPKSANLSNLSYIPNSTKSENLTKHQKE